MNIFLGSLKTTVAKKQQHWHYLVAAGFFRARFQPLALFMQQKLNTNAMNFNKESLLVKRSGKTPMYFVVRFHLSFASLGSFLLSLSVPLPLPLFLFLVRSYIFFLSSHLHSSHNHIVNPMHLLRGALSSLHTNASRCIAQHIKWAHWQQAQSLAHSHHTLTNAGIEMHNGLLPC